MTTNNSFMIQADLQQLYTDGTLDAITHKLLLHLFSRGNMVAYDIMTGKNNGQVTIEDLTQELLAFLLEHPSDWYLFRPCSRYSTDERTTKLVFLSNDTQKQFFSVVSTTLYRERTRHENRKLWIEMDGEEMRIDDISAIASHVCIDDVMTLSLYNIFCSYLITTKPKKAQRYISELNLRLHGYKYKDIATRIGIKLNSTKKDFEELRTLWKEFTK